MQNIYSKNAQIIGGVKHLKSYEIIANYIGEENLKMNKIYNIRIQSSFVLTPTQIKEKLGVGFKVLETSVEKESADYTIDSVESAMNAIIKTGYRALARANHPDLGGDANVMVILNRTKKELEALLEEIKL